MATVAQVKLSFSQKVLHRVLINLHRNNSFCCTDHCIITHILVNLLFRSVSEFRYLDLIYR